MHAAVQRQRDASGNKPCRTKPVLVGYTALPSYPIVFTVAETAAFVRYAAEVWSDAER